MEIAGVLLVTAIAYLRCLPNRFVFDDNEMIVLNRYLGQWWFIPKSFINDSWWFRDPLHLPQSAYYRPLQDTWLAINYQLFGLHPIGWHVTMVALHLVAVYLVLRLARELCGGGIGPVVAALLFGLMPIHAQAVVWPSAVPLPMSAVFEMGALLLFIRGRRSMALGMFVLALLSHESAVVFPLVIAAYVFWIHPGTIFPDGAQESSRQPLAARLKSTLVASWGFFAATAVYLGLRLWILGFISRPNEANHATMGQVLMTIPSALANYAMLLMMPWRAGPVHPVSFVSSIASSDFYLPLLALGAISVGVTIALRRHPRRALYLFCAAWLLIPLMPVLNLGALSPLFPVEDRYLYLPSAPWCIILGDVIAGLIARAAVVGSVAAIGVGALGFVYAASLWYVQGYWRDDIALFSRCVEVYPRHPFCHTRLGLALEEVNLKAAERQLLIADRLDPNDGATLYNLGVVHRRLGKKEEAVSEIARALKLFDHPPAGAWLTLAELYDETGDEESSDKALDRAAKLPGGDAVVMMARARRNVRHGDRDAAEAIFRKMLEKYPSYAAGWAALGSLLGAENRGEEAISDLRRAVALAPEITRFRTILVAWLYRLGDRRGAIVEARRALARDPDDAALRALMAQISRRAPTAR